MTTPSDQDLRRMLADGVVIHIGGHYYLVAKAIGWDPQSGQPIKWAPYREVDAQDAIAELNRLAALSGEIARLKGEVEAEKAGHRVIEETDMEEIKALNKMLDAASSDAARWKERAERAEAEAADSVAQLSAQRHETACAHRLARESSADADRLAGLLERAVVILAHRTPGHGVNPNDKLSVIQDIDAALAGRGGRKEG